MEPHGLDALVVRAPDNVLYLSNYWGMKGYEVVVFPREGEPTLVTMEPSKDDAERNAWTDDIRLFAGYDELDPSPPSARALALAQEAAGEYERGRARALARHPGGRPHGRRADDLHAGLVRGLPRRDRRDPAPERRARDQDRAGDRAHAARERDRLRGDGVLPRASSAGNEGERGGRDVGGVRAQPGHGPRGRRARARLLARLVGAGDPHLHGDRQPAGPGTSRRSSRSGSAPTATGATTRRTSVRAS